MLGSTNLTIGPALQALLKTLISLRRSARVQGEFSTRRQAIAHQRDELAAIFFSEESTTNQASSRIRQTENTRNFSWVLDESGISRDSIELPLDWNFEITSNVMRAKINHELFC
jgi:preprotein translocase subunit SecD